LKLRLPVLVDDPRADVLLGLPEPKLRALGSATTPSAGVEDVERLHQHAAARRRTFRRSSSASSTWMYVFHTAGWRPRPSAS
jgi:hypothetical protein